MITEMKHPTGKLCLVCVVSGLDCIVQCFTSPPTQYRLYGRREWVTQ